MTDRCATCHEWLFSYERRGHVCKPEWLVLDADEGPWDPSEARSMRGSDAEEAAEKWAEDRDSDGDRSVLEAGSIDVWIASVDEPQKATRWRVSAEAQVHYSAEALDSDPPGSSDETT